VNLTCYKATNLAIQMNCVGRSRILSASITYDAARPVSACHTVCERLQNSSSSSRRSRRSIMTAAAGSLCCCCYVGGAKLLLPMTSTFHYRSQKYGPVRSLCNTRF